MVFLGVSEISWEKCLCWGLFLMKLLSLGSESLLKRDSLLYDIIFLRRLFWYLGCFSHFSVDLLNKFENFISGIIIHFIFYDFSLVILVGFVGAIILSLFKVLLRVFSDTRYYTFYTIHKIILHT